MPHNPHQDWVVLYTSKRLVAGSSPAGATKWLVRNGLRLMLSWCFVRFCSRLREIRGMSQIQRTERTEQRLCGNEGLF